MFKHKRLTINIILMVIAMLYFIVKIFTCDSGGSFGFDGFGVVIWIIKIIEIWINLALIMSSYYSKDTLLYKIMMIIGLIFNTIAFMYILSVMNEDLIVTYLLPFICSLFQVFGYSEIKKICSVK